MPGFVSLERLTYGSWQAFERMIARLVKHAGFANVMIVAGSGDQGADVVALLDGKRWVLQAKFRGAGSIDGNGLREAIRACSSYRGDVAVAIANSTFSPDAYEVHASAKLNGAELYLWNGNHLIEYYERLPPLSSEYRELRSYQCDAVEAVEERRAAGRKNALVVMATGLGKSIVATQLIANELSRNPGQEVLVLAHVSDLVRQLEISSWTQLEKSASTHLWTDGERPAYTGGVTFATWQSVISALTRGEPLAGRYGLIIVDEAHHAPSLAFSRLLTELQPNFLVGLTATPWRGDEQVLTDLFGDPVFTMDVVEGMQRGYLANVQYKMLTDGIDWEVVANMSRQGLTVADLNRYLLVPERDAAMVDLICSKMATIQSARALAFCRSIEHAERLRPMFSAKGVRAAVLHSNLPREQKFRNLSAFRNGEIDVLISIEMLNEGIDVPDVNIIAFMRVTHSRRIFLQQLGRGLRVTEEKKEVLVLDFVADIRRISAGMSMNKRAADIAAKLEVVRYREGEIVQFEDASVGEFFDEYLADVADFEDIAEGARLKFPARDEGGF